MATSQPCNHSHANAGLAGPRLAAALAAAAKQCEAARARLTASRRRVFELLLQADRPTKAYDLIARFYSEDRAAPPPTVYRALDFLERQGLVHRIASMNAYVACQHSDRLHVAVFMICDCCHSLHEASPSASSSLFAPADIADFQVRRIAIEAHGLCAACAPAALI
jgi:Fur family zinc uptake transcriptional regulator